MAYTFKEGKMASNVLDSMLAGGVSASALKDGSLVVLGDLVADTTYIASGDYQYDVYELSLPAAATDEVAIVDYAGISEGPIAGNVYKMGNKLYDLEVPAGELTRVRRLALHDKFWLGEDNFESTPTVGEFAEAKASSGKHDPKSSLTGGQYGIKVLLEKDLTAGMKSVGKIYLCEVVAL